MEIATLTVVFSYCCYARLEEVFLSWARALLCAGEWGHSEEGLRLVCEMTVTSDMIENDRALFLGNDDVEPSLSCSGFVCSRSAQENTHIECLVMLL